MARSRERARDVAHLLWMRRQVGLARRPRRRLPRQVPPRTIELEYTRELLRVLARTRQELAPLFGALPGLLARAAQEREDTRQDAGEGKRAQELIDEAQDRLQDALRPRDLEQLAEKFARRTTTYQRVQLERQTRAALGTDVFLADRAVPTLVDGFVAENVALIRDIPKQVAADIEKAVTRAVANATPHPELAKEIESRFVIAERRAKLIARDQIGKVYGQVNAARQRELGVGKFVWRTMNDERVRPEHVAIDGQTFSYPDGHPEEGLPGVHAVNCRCYGEPVFDDVLSELSELENPTPQDVVAAEFTLEEDE